MNDTSRWIHGALALLLVAGLVRPNPASAQLGSTWARGEYLLWWTDENYLPALVTTSPAGTQRTDAGVLGAPGTEVLFGDEGIDQSGRSGFRLTMGVELDMLSGTGLQASWFSVFDDPQSGEFLAASPGSPTIARPFFDASTSQQVSELTAFTDPNNTTIAEGSIAIQSSTEMHSAAISLTRLYREGSRGRVDLLGGYRFFRLREALLMDEQVIARDPGGLVAVGTTFDLRDRFVTRNEFHGGELGVQAEFFADRASVELLAKVALGYNYREVLIDGHTTVTDPPPAGASLQTSGGLLAQPTNIGRHRDNEFAVLPEFGVNVNVGIAEWCTLTAGYTLLLLDNVVRTGSEIDTAVNSTQIGGGGLLGAARPQPLLNDSSYWAQGLGIGITFLR